MELTTAPPPIPIPAMPVQTCHYCGWDLRGSEIVHGMCGDCEKRGED